MKMQTSWKNALRRVFALAMAFVLVLGMLPAGVLQVNAAEGTVLYLKPNENWKSDGARFAAYFFGNGDTWVGMSDDDGDGYYECTAPEGYPNVIFCRMNPGAEENNWNSKWNQTGDLTVPTDGTNCYTVAEGTWDNGGGEWSAYTPGSTETPDPEPEPEPEKAYYVAGDSSLCGTNWKENDEDNKMTKDGDVYKKVYPNVAPGTYNLKVTDGTWDNSWGDGSNNLQVTVSTACDLTVTFDPDAKTVTVTGDGLGEEEAFEVTSIRAVGNGKGAWLNGVDWQPDNDENLMRETSEGIYEITYKSVPAATGYEVKFTANKEGWTHSWGGAFTASGEEAEAVYNGSNIKFDLEDESDVTLKLDLTNLDADTKAGGKFAVTMEEPKAPEVPAVDYYLIGYINGADYGCEGDSANFGEYKFVNGKLSAKFEQDSYVFIKTGDNANWYMAETYCADKTVTLKNTTTGTSEKLFVPGGTELEFTLAVNEDDTLTLSYEAVSPITPIQPEKIIAAGNGADLGDGKWLNGIGWAPGDDNNKMTETAPGIYEITYKDVPRGKGYAVKFAADGGWDTLANWGGTFEESGKETDAAYKGDNITFDILHESADVTLKLDLTRCDANTKQGAKFTITIEGHGEQTYTTNLHFQKPADWNDTINAWIWDANGKIPGYEDYNTTWPGKAVEKNSHNLGWYTVQVAVKNSEGFSFIFNDGSAQTGSLSTGTLEPVKDIWIANGQILPGKPEGWLDSSRTANVPGTFPGPSWDAASNEMTYDPELGLYVYTFKDVPAANYEYKIAINGSWNENYGAGGEKDGGNIAVAVPETMDVTVYYNDVSHNSVTSVTYSFLDITLSGTGISEGTKLTDTELTGIYSQKVALEAGSYEDIQLTLGEEVFAFAPFQLEEGKEVTFYFDPASKLYYHDASDVKVGEEAIFFDSKDIAYKAPFGAVAAGEDVTFAIRTGDDVTQAILVIKGLDSYPMAQPEVAAYELGTKHWTCTVQIPKPGEYDYYFALSNGSDVKVYGDDDGYYGTGKVSNLDGVTPYDLVVYKSGFETPDWMKNAVIYQIFPDRFFDGDPGNNQAQTTARGDVDYEYIPHWYTLPENPEQEQMNPGSYPSNAHLGDGEWSNEIYGGDLEGITQKMDYLKALGVNVIYLNPVFSSISSHRYDACDYMKIDPILGDLGDFTELVKAAENNGMHIILDGVFNHVSDDSIYFDRYYKFVGQDGKVGAYPYWAYVYDEMNANGTSLADAKAMAKTYFAAKGVTDFTYVDWFDVFNKPLTVDGEVAKDAIGDRAGKEVYGYDGWWGYDSMPIIKSTNGSEYQTGNGTWANEIISGGDSVTQYWIRKGNDGWRLDVANEVSDETWQEFRQSVKSLNSDAVIVGEIWDDATKYLMGDMYDSVMNYLFRNAVTDFAKGSKTAQQATNELEKVRERYPEEAFYAMMNLVGSHDTTRLLSYLDGIDDDRNQKDPQSAFPIYAATSSAAKQMQYLVAFLQFTYPGAPTIYYGDEIGMVGADDPDDRRAMEWGKGNKELVEWYAKLAAIREEYPALRTGDLTVLETENENLMGYERSLDGQTLIVIGNNSPSSQEFQLEGSYTDIITGETYTGTVPGRNGVILVSSEEYQPVSIREEALACAYNGNTVPDRLPHKHSYTEQVHAPSCTEEGYTEYTCSCGESYRDNYVEKLEHEYQVDTVVDPTCTTEGYTLRKCKHCGDEKKTDTAALGHNYQDTVVKPTCSKEGYTEHTCAVCKESYKDAVTAKDLKNHGDTVLKDKKEPTCEEKGYTGDKYCEDCGDRVEKGKTIAKLKHQYVNGYCKACGSKKPAFWNPFTGDAFPLTLCVGIMVVSGAALAVILVLKKKRK